MTKARILRQIRQFCLECMGGSSVEVEACTAPRCQLFELRRGKDPSPSKKGFGSRPHGDKTV
jgi:hypothetical protein